MANPVTDDGKDPPPPGQTVDEQLDDVQVHPPGMWENGDGPEDWFAVSTADRGIIAYFGDESMACFFRLALVNARLNPIK